jgi:proteasome lid subunit RPN8/RPN11
MPLSDTVLRDLRAHAEATYPAECCGLVQIIRGRERYTPCRNVAINAGQFAIDPADYAAAEDAGEIIAIAHSHCNQSARPSEADRVGCERSGKPWIIVAWPTGETQTLEPAGYRAPLVGRPFVHGILDCYALCRDYYRETLGIELPDYARQDEWWLKGENLYRANFAEAGFVEIDNADMRQHDALLMQVASPVENHAAIVLGNGLILQHVMNRLSSRDVYGGWYRKCTRAVLRHRSLLPC